MRRKNGRIFGYIGEGRRTWRVSFEEGKLEITADSYPTKRQPYLIEEHFSYSGYVSFRRKSEGQNKLKNDLDSFIADAKNYRKYCNKNIHKVYGSISIHESE